MANVSILLDGDATRRLIKRKLKKNPKPGEIEDFCRSIVHPDENIVETMYYDCEPFGQVRIRPVSGTQLDFSSTVVYTIAKTFQTQMIANPFFKFRKGYLSFDGWTVKKDTVDDLLTAPRSLADVDFVPMLSQKQVDMKIALDVAKIALSGSAQKIVMVTCDSDFIPMIDFAKSKKLDVELVLDRHSILKKRLKDKFTALRYV